MVYPMFDRSTTAALATHAENEYAQTLEETGLAGFLSLARLGIMVWAAYGRTIRQSRQPIRNGRLWTGIWVVGDHAPEPE